MGTSGCPEVCDYDEGRKDGMDDSFSVVILTEGIANKPVMSAMELSLSDISRFQPVSSYSWL